MFQDETVNLHRIEFDPQRAKSLSEFITQLETENVEINKIVFCQRGFMITFKDLPGDAVLHDGSYGRDLGMWETIDMPWDNDDVSVHEPKELARMLGALKRGEDWENLPPEKKGKHEKSYKYEWEE